ncbi:hypothetical protein EG329_003881 [Mollisiaceae sp. DMI_Dod_QoI]|nr:hypothetical protein EG329_003881 [Helotiales sp. DMI_Dod_QoI]
MSVPLQILRRLRLRTHERRILKMVFCATLLGTITCAIGIYGAYETRTQEGNHAFWQETAFVMMSDIEILMYTLGASFPVLSRYMVQRAAPGPGEAHENFSSWARYVPNFFLTDTLASQNRTNHRSALSRSRHENTNIDERALKSSDGDADLSTCNTPDLQAQSCGSESGRSTSMSSNESGIEESKDLEKGDVVRLDTEVRVSREVEGEILEEYMRNSHVIGQGW